MNPLRMPTFHAPNEVADTISMLLRTGMRQPALARQTLELHPNLPNEVFNGAADRVWERLIAEERRVAAGEAD